MNACACEASARSFVSAASFARVVATGRAEIMLDPAMNPWDCAPLLPILAEAGGHFTNWQGEATIWGKDAGATNASLHREVIEVLRNEKRRG